MIERGSAHASTVVTIPGFRILDVLHASGPRVVCRAVREDGGDVVVLKTLAPDYPHKRDVAELRREFRILEKLRVEGVLRPRSLVTWGAGSVAIELDPFGESLASLLEARRPRSFPWETVVTLAVGMARILGQLHEQNVIHKDVVPHNILVDPDSWELRLVDFAICSELSRERQSATLSARLEGSLPYISPEQTGRMSRDVDYRSDYYSLGVTLFELATGRLPFTADGPLQWVNRHISQPAPAAREVNRDVPAPLSAIISKLMSKAAEDRYQSTFGLIADLERCRGEVAEGGPAASFSLGEADVPRIFRIPQTLYGREAEVDQLLSLFDDVAHGGTGICLVSGHAGVGKSALVKELGRAVVRAEGYLIEGKFDHFHQSATFSALAAAIRGLVEQLLVEPEARVEHWREVLRAALGRNGRLIVDLVPEIELIIGEQPPVPVLPPAEAQNRFQIVFRDFVKALADRRHPLVLFLDDLQWSDVPTLGLLERLVTARDMSHLLVVGSYRATAVDANHPLAVTLDQIRKTREVVELELEPLEPEAVELVTADALYADVERVRPLSRLIHEKSQGNPFFIKELLRSLHEDGAVRFEPERGRWEWDLDAVRGALVGENVVEFMVANLRRLREPTRQALQLASCIGNTFDLRTLSVIAQRSMPGTAGDLQEALEHGVLIPLGEGYKFVTVDGAGEERADGGSRDGPSVNGVNPSYRFQHDRVQQAAYALIDPARKKAVHLSVGRLMLRHGSEADVRARLIDIVGHLDEGRELIRDPAEQLELARLNLEAGLQAQRSAAYDSALAFFRIGQELLPADPWEREYDLMLALSSEVQQCAYLTGDLDEADAWTETLLERARTPLAKAEILSARTRQYATIGRMRRSIEAAIAGLRLLGVEVVDEPDADDVAREVAWVAESLGERTVEDLLDAPEVTDPEARVAIRLLMEVFAAAFLSGSGDLFPYLVLKSVGMSMRHGVAPESAFAYAAYGMLLCGALDDPALGYRYGKVAVAMNDRLNDIALRSRIVYVYAMFVHHWTNHWSSMTPWFLKGIEAGYQSGDLLYLAYSAQDCIIWDPTLDLDVASREQRKYLAIVKDCDYQDSYDSGTLFLQMQLNFQGLTESLYSLDDDTFDEVACVEGMRQRRFMTGIANYHIYKAEIHFLYGDYPGALKHVRAQDELIASAMSLPQLVRFYVVAFLTRSALYPHMPGDEQVRTLRRLEEDRDRMAHWAGNCPENFEHLRLTMEAELARLTHRVPDALRLYEEAIAAAGSSRFRRDEAVANELAGLCLLGMGLSRAAEGYLRAAHYLFDGWGARRKVERMEEAYPFLKGRRSAGGRAGAEAEPDAHSVDPASLDMSSVMKASQTISGEIVLEQLWRTTLHILLENAGAQRGFFVLREGDDLVVRARAEAGREDAPLSAPLPLTGDDPVLPVSVVNNVVRTGTPLVLEDASRGGRFAADPYVVAHRPRSVICIPITRHERFSGAIYMENNLTTGAFSEERVEVLKLLSAQAAISMENATLYGAQVRLTEAQKRFVPAQFLESLGHGDIAGVGLGESVAREMSVLFADLRRFTPLAERLGPRAVIELLNRYFSRVGEPIAAAGGFIDSYSGDEVMALFPLPADRAVEAGIGMARALEQMNREAARDGGPLLEAGTGVNTGHLVLGTVGSHDRLKCGVVGDTVNTASRIEQLTKLYGASFLIGEATRESLGDAGRYSLRLVDRVAVKGKQSALSIYQVLDAEPLDRRAAMEASRVALDEAMALYHGREFDRAHTLFAEARRRDPEDPVLTLFVERARRYVVEPPPPDWEGFESLDHK